MDARCNAYARGWWSMEDIRTIVPRLMDDNTRDEA